MLSPVCAQPTWLFDHPAATGFFKSVSGMSSETEVVGDCPQPPARVVTNNKDDDGRYRAQLNAGGPVLGSKLMEPDGIGWDFAQHHSGPFADGLIAYNGHAGLGGNAVAGQREPTQVEFPNIA